MSQDEEEPQGPINTTFVGCGRCPLGETPDCKAKKWLKEFKLLRTILLSCGLEEEVKWGVPCYMVEKQNVLVMSGF